MILSKRQTHILKIILQSQAYVSTLYLSEKFGVTSRTIRYDLSDIKYFLSKYNIVLEKKQGKGVYIQTSNSAKKSILQKLENSTNIYQSKENSIYTLTILLLLSQKTTITSLADYLEISKNKVHQSLKSIEHILDKLNISISKKPSIGIYITGDEFQIRLALVKLNQSTNGEFYNYILGLIDKDIYTSITDILNEYQTKKQIRFSDNALNELILVLCYQQVRIKQRHIISMEKYLNIYPNYKENSTKENINIIVSLYEYKGLSICIDEANFAFSQILNAKLAYLPTTTNYERYGQEADEITGEIARLAEIKLDMNFIQNEIFIKGLQLHLYHTLQRMSSGEVITNPLTEHIKYKYRFIFEITKSILSQIEDDKKLIFPEEEIAYIAIYICSAFEISKGDKFMPSSLVVCNTGVATSTLITTRLRTMIPDLKIVGSIGLSQLNNFNISNIDFIISTVPINIEGKEVIIVNPLLDLEDISKLRTVCFKFNNQKKLASIIPKENRLIKYSMGEIIDVTRIQLKKDITNWRSAIYQASLPMLEENFIEKIYIQEMIKAVEELGPYMVFIQGVAFVHSSPKLGVLKEGLSILTLDKPIIFGDKSEIYVTCIIIFSSLEKRSQLFLKIIYLLENRQNLNILLQASKHEDILNLEGCM